MTRHILITGGSRGIGAATAVACAARGWNVTVNYASDEAAASATVAVLEAAGVRAQAIRGDMSKAAEIAALWDAAAAGLGPVDGLVNNAGIVGPAMPLADMEPERIARLIELNVTGAILVAREGARRMPVSRGGQGGGIVNISSAAARLGSANTFVDYAASKGAIDTLTIGLAQELAPLGVRVNAVRPGIVATEIHKTSHGNLDRLKDSAPMIPLRRVGEPQEIAEAVCWLLSDASSYATGALLDVAGGR